MKPLGEQIAGEGKQQTDQNLRSALLTDTARDRFLCLRRQPRNAEADSDTAQRDPNEAERGIGQRERAGQYGGDRETQTDEAGRVVEKRLAFQNVHQPSWDGYARGNGRHGDRIGRRYHRRQRERDGERHCRDHPVHEEAHTDHGQNDQAERQFEDRRPVLEQFLVRDAPAVEEQERRNEEEEEDFRIEFDPQVGDKADYPTQRDLNQRPGNRQRQQARQEAAYDRRDHENKDDCNGFQRRALFPVSLS